MGCHHKVDIAVVKNMTGDSLLLAKQSFDRMNDSILYNESFSEDLLALIRILFLFPIFT